MSYERGVVRELGAVGEAICAELCELCGRSPEEFWEERGDFQRELDPVSGLEYARDQYGYQECVIGPLADRMEGDDY